VIGGEGDENSVREMVLAEEIKQEIEAKMKTL